MNKIKLHSVISSKRIKLFNYKGWQTGMQSFKLTAMKRLDNGYEKAYEVEEERYEVAKRRYEEAN